MARRSPAVFSLWCLALIASAPLATGAADVPASGAPVRHGLEEDAHRADWRDDGSDVGSIDAVNAIGGRDAPSGAVAIVFVTSRDAESLSPCRAGLLRALRASVADMPDHDVFVLHGGNATGPMARRPDDADDVALRPATMLSQSALGPLVPERLRCDCSSGNGATPFAFMAWLAASRAPPAGDGVASSAARREMTRKKDYAFAWYVEEDVVFTGNWREVFRLRTVSTPESRVREVEVFGELSGASLPSPPRDESVSGGDANDAFRDAEDENRNRPGLGASTDASASFATSPVDVVAHVERVEFSWKKRCRMPGDGSVSRRNGTGCVGDDGFAYRAWWPVIGLSRDFATRLADSVADADGANGHQEPLTMSFCVWMNREKNREVEGAASGGTNATRREADPRGCAFRLVPGGVLGEYQLGHWGRFVGRPRSHPTFTAPGLTYGHNLAFDRLYHPLKCEADAGIGALAAACAGGRLRRDGAERAANASSVAERTSPRRALAADEGGGGGGGGGAETAGAREDASLRALRETYFEKKRWALAFDDGRYGGRFAGTARDARVSSPGGRLREGAWEGDAAAYAAAIATAKERNEATASRARAAARPYARPVRGPKKKTTSGG